jgi:predicted metal-dependent enzyme (double-stranded beta helix superfamily)
MNAISRPIIGLSATPIDAMLARIALAANAPLTTRHRAAAEAIRPFLGDRNLLAGRDCPCNPQRYCRHLLHNNPTAGYAVIAIVWTPGQMSPVHAHRTWCAFGVHCGWLAETIFSRNGETVLPNACTSRTPGTTGHASADPDAIHRLANLGTEDAISIHVYGVAFDDFGTGVNEVYAA